MLFRHDPADVVIPHPAVPSLILTATQVTYTQAGPQGQKGEKGDIGAKGATGAQGPKGATGSKGNLGTKGQKGVEGSPSIVQVATSMFENGEANQTNIGVVFGDIPATANATTTSTASISVLVGKDPFVNMEITATISLINGTSVVVEPVVVSAFNSSTGSITFKHANTGESRTIMYHVFYQNG
jgi:hypothetical protein